MNNKQQLEHEALSFPFTELPNELQMYIVRFVRMIDVPRFMRTNSICAELVRSQPKYVLRRINQGLGCYVVQRVDKNFILIRYTKNGKDWTNESLEKALSASSDRAEIHRLGFTFFNGILHVSYNFIGQPDINVDYYSDENVWKSLARIPVTLRELEKLSDLKLTQYKNQLWLGYISRLKFKFFIYTQDKFTPIAVKETPQVFKFDFIQFQNCLYIAYARNIFNGDVEIIYTKDGTNWPKSVISTRLGTLDSISLTIFQDKICVCMINTYFKFNRCCSM